MTAYKVQFEVFEGPLDLLLYLVKKEEVDIYEINLTKVATQFLEYVEMMRQLDLEVAGEFLVMAATLMYIKSRELLPVEQQVEAEAEEEADPRWDLIRQLVEYRKFKDAAARLQAVELEQEGIYQRQPAPPVEDLAVPRAGGAEASLFDLLSAVNLVLRRFEEPEAAREIVEDRWTVSERIEHLRALVNERRSLRFSELFAATTSRSEVVATFLALLELIRLRQVWAIQEELFGEIEIRCPNPEPPAAAAAAATDAVPSETHGTEIRN
jgi:segregation and condensation protein A